MDLSNLSIKSNILEPMEVSVGPDTIAQMSVPSEPATAQFMQVSMPSYGLPLHDPMQIQTLSMSDSTQTVSQSYGMPMGHQPRSHLQYGTHSLRPWHSLSGLYNLPTKETSQSGNNTAAVSALAESFCVPVVQARRPTRCWEHGCNGRRFSSTSNLLRHQREKSGQTAKAACPRCKARFTRTTARNEHLSRDKCRKRQLPTSAA